MHFHWCFIVGDYYKIDLIFVGIIWKHWIKFQAPEMPWPDHQWALCIFDDAIEYGGPACAKYQEYFLQPMLNYVTDKSAEVRQAAVYGWGVLGQFGGEAFAGW